MANSVECVPGLPGAPWNLLVMAENIVVDPRRIGAEKPLLPTGRPPALVALLLLAVEDRRLALLASEEHRIMGAAPPVAACSSAFTVADISFFSFDTCGFAG
jgi:hypothetical protein